MSIKLENNKDNNINRIKDYSTSLDKNDITNANIIEIEKTAFVDNSIITFNDIIYPENMDNIDTEKVQELISNGHINFTEKYLDKNYITNIYKFRNISQGCEFNIITDKNINSNKKSIDITTQFIEYSTSNIIDINCTLTPSNNNIIKCKTNQELNNYYTPKDLIYYDEDELFIIYNENKEETNNLLCNINPIATDHENDEPIASTIVNIAEPNHTDAHSNYDTVINSKKSDSSSKTIVIIGVAIGIVVLAVVGTIIYCCVCKERPVENIIDTTAQINIGENPTNNGNKDNISKLNNNPRILKVGSSANLQGNENAVENSIKSSEKGEINFVIKIQYTIKISVDFNKKCNELRAIFFKKINRTDLIQDKSIILSLENNEAIDPNKLIKDYFDIKSHENYIIIVEKEENKINNTDIENISDTGSNSDNNSENSKLETIPFQDSKGDIRHIKIELKKTLKDLRELYFKSINREDLIDNKNIIFLLNGNSIPLNSSNEPIEKYYKKGSKVVIVVVDLSTQK